MTKRRAIIALFVAVNLLLYGFIARTLVLRESPSSAGGSNSQSGARTTAVRQSEAPQNSSVVVPEKTTKVYKDSRKPPGNPTALGWEWATLESPKSAPARNPFAQGFASKTSPQAPSQSAISAPQAPLQAEFELRGILGDRSGFLAIVEEKDGNSRTVKAGDLVGGGRVIEIQKDAVILEKKGRKLKVQSDSVQEIP
jgi:hypothetical protein